MGNSKIGWKEHMAMKTVFMMTNGLPTMTRKCLNNIFIPMNMNKTVHALLKYVFLCLPC